MAIDPLQHVQPGDLITSDVAERGRRRAQAISDRSSLHSSHAVAAARLHGRATRADGQPDRRRCGGDPLTLFGQNFGPLASPPSPSAHSRSRTFLPGSSETQLSFAVPSTSRAGDRHGLGDHAAGDGGCAPVLIAPAAPVQSGRCSSTSGRPPRHDQSSGSTYTFQWDVRSNTLLPDTYTFNVDLTNVSRGQRIGVAGATLLNTTPRRSRRARPSGRRDGHGPTAAGASGQRHAQRSRIDRRPLRQGVEPDRPERGRRRR